MQLSPYSACPLFSLTTYPCRGEVPSGSEATWLVRGLIPESTLRRIDT
jgi:hypothetical protein